MAAFLLSGVLVEVPGRWGFVPGWLGRSLHGSSLLEDMVALYLKILLANAEVPQFLPHKCPL